MSRHTAALNQKASGQRLTASGRYRSNPLTIGSLAWAYKRGGQLSRQEQWRIFGKMMVVEGQRLWQHYRRRWGWQPYVYPFDVDLDQIRIPDTAVAREAAEFCATVASPALLNHSLRSYFWGAILAQKEKIAYDRELFYVAALLHDLGLTDSYTGKRDGVHCFAVEGAKAAQQFVQQKGWDSGRAHKVAEAISLHINIQVDLKQGPEAHLLHAGTAFDVIGARYREISPATIQAVLGRYPRLDIEQELQQRLWHEQQFRPLSRASQLVDWGFNDRIAQSPFLTPMVVQN